MNDASLIAEAKTRFIFQSGESDATGQIAPSSRRKN
jgi:hypothetical protein